MTRRADFASMRRLMVCGVAVCPTFYTIVVAQMLFRPGFHITNHPLSLLSLGASGWIQVANFITCGVLAMLGAAGLWLTDRPGRAMALASILVALFGTGLVLAGLFPPDPLPGFPPGAQAPVAGHISRHAIGHGMGFFLAFVSLVGADVVFAQLFRETGRKDMASASIAVGIITLGLIALGMINQQTTGLAFFAVGIVAFGWLAIVMRQFMIRDA